MKELKRFAFYYDRNKALEFLEIKTPKFRRSVSQYLKNTVCDLGGNRINRSTFDLLGTLTFLPEFEKYLVEGKLQSANKLN